MDGSARSAAWASGGRQVDLGHDAEALVGQG
jgi:hypothetical protein